MRKSMRSEVGESRKARIAALVTIGLDNDAILAAMQHVYPQTIENKELRAAICKSKGIPVPMYDEVEKNRLGWAIRQVKGLMLKEDSKVSDILKEHGVNEIKSPDDIEFTNRSRFSSGIGGIDMVYGYTTYRWTTDAPNSEYEKRKGRMVWVSGDYRRGDLMPADLDFKYGPEQWVASEPRLAKIEHGLPDSFLSIWGGSPGAGKTRIAIAVCKSLNVLGHKTLYFNGEAAEMDFRMWLGADVDNDLFRVVSGEVISTEDAVEKVYAEKPKVVIFDSAQMLAESRKKGDTSLRNSLTRFKMLKCDEEAGKPHIILICQLNKSKDLYGPMHIQHEVDFVATVVKSRGKVKKGTQNKNMGNMSVFGCYEKNRGGETPKEAVFRLNETGIEWMNTEDVPQL